MQSSRSKAYTWVLLLLLGAVGMIYWLVGERSAFEPEAVEIERLPDSKGLDSLVETPWESRGEAVLETVGEPSNEPAEPEIVSDVVGNELIVSVRQGTTIEGLAQRYGAEVVGRLDGISTYRLRFADKESTDAVRDALKNNPGVAEVQDNVRIPLPPAPAAVGDADRLLAGKELQPVDSESPVVVGLIDSSVNLSDSSLSGFLLEQMTVAEAGAVANADIPTHGSAVFAAMLEGMKLGSGETSASSVKILPVDVYGDAGETTSFQVAQGVVAAMENGATIINMSLGSEGQGGTLMQDIVASGRELGVVFVGAAGNEPVTTPNYPAALPDVLAVTSIDGNGQIAAYANRGSFIDIGLPGTVNFPYGSYVYSSQGTSMSAGVASGLAASLAEKNSVTVTEAEALVKESFKVRTESGE